MGKINDKSGVKRFGGCRRCLVTEGTAPAFINIVLRPFFPL